MNRQRQTLCVTQIQQVDPWVRCFRLEAALPGEQLAPFQPGQFLNLFYEIDGTTTSRPYSIASSPGDREKGYYELLIHGGGSFTSPWLFRNAQVGSVLTSSYPEGGFCFDPLKDSRKLIAFSGGMSVTPLRSFARAVVEGSLDAELTVFCGWDYGKDALFYDEFRQYEGECSRFHAVFASAKEDSPGMLRGYVDRGTAERFVTGTDASVFLCGPQEMYRFLERELSLWKIPPERWHEEIPGEMHTPDGPQPEDRQVLLTVLRDGQQHTVPARTRETLLTALERAGLHPESRCRCGTCGYCLSTLLDGEVYVPAALDGRSSWEKGKNKIHPCCSFPLCDVVIKCGEAEEF